MQYIFAILLMLAVFERSVADDKCKEEDLKNCLITLQRLLMNQFDGIKKGDKDLSGYCQTLKQEGQCLKDASKSCKEDHQMISNLVSTFYAYLNQFCNEKAKLYMDIVPCFESNKEAFEECFLSHRVRRDEDNVEDICMEMDSMQCVANLSKEKCEDGTAFGNALEEKVKQLKADMCSSAAVSQEARSFWALLAAIVTVIIVMGYTRKCY